MNRQTMDTVLQLRDITISFGKKTVIDNLSLDLYKGEIVSLLGENGSGKSTLMKIIVGLVLPDQGEILVNGINPKQNQEEALKQISAQIEEPVFYENMSAQDNLHLFTSLKDADEKRANELLDMFNLSGHRKKKVKKFSIGMRRRLQLAICLAYDAPLYILDEPFSGMDHQGVADLEALLMNLRDKGHTLLISSHQSEPLLKIQDREFKMVKIE
ncbi:MAG TPA: ATP-binding cassette domain-containing protein [Fastidiosipila sp.]|nr:ATP-binding cassette domain-containing protein [Fastidiosipila sp.]